MKNALRFAALLALAIPLAASAHVLKVNGEIGALLHTDPADAPLVGSPTAFYLQFKDSVRPLNLKADYVLDLVVSTTAGLVHHIPSADLRYAGNEVDFDYAFPAEGAYTLKVAGTSNTPGRAPFTLIYDVLAGAENPDYDSDIDTFDAFDANATSTPAAAGGFLATHTLHIVLFGGGILVALVLMGRDFYLRRKQKSGEPTN